MPASMSWLGRMCPTSATPGGRTAQSADRLCLPELQLAAADQCAGERGRAPAVPGDPACGQIETGPGCARASRAGRSGRSRSDRALRGPVAAGGDRPGSGGGAGAADGRRADGQPRQPLRRRGAGAVRRPAPGWHHRPDDHPRPRGGQSRPAAPGAGRRSASGRRLTTTPSDREEQAVQQNPTSPDATGVPVYDRGGGRSPWRDRLVAGVLCLVVGAAGGFALGRATASSGPATLAEAFQMAQEGELPQGDMQGPGGGQGFPGGQGGQRPGGQGPGGQGGAGGPSVQGDITSTDGDVLTISTQAGELKV